MQIFVSGYADETRYRDLISYGGASHLKTQSLVVLSHLNDTVINNSRSLLFVTEKQQSIPLPLQILYTPTPVELGPSSMLAKVGHINDVMNSPQHFTAF